MHTDDGAASRLLRVLVVDDDVDVARTIGRALDLLLGHDVRVAHDGVAAIDAAVTFGPDAVILDLGLPGADGFEVARALRAHPATAPARLVALTGGSSAAERRRARDAGFDAHLVKPAGIAAIESVLAGVPVRADV